MSIYAFFALRVSYVILIRAVETFFTAPIFILFWKAVTTTRPVQDQNGTAKDC